MLGIDITSSREDISIRPLFLISADLSIGFSNTMNITVVTNMMAIAFSRNRNIPEENIFQSIKAIPMPPTHKGGISEVAMATPESVSDILGLDIPMAAMKPPAMAIMISITFGFVLANISEFITFKGEIIVIIVELTIPIVIDKISKNIA